MKIIESEADLVSLENSVTASAGGAVDALRGLLVSGNPLDAFAKIKFEECGFHPSEGRSLNLIEQINQTFTYLASVHATRWLLQEHPEAAPYRLNLGTEGGTDVESVDGSVRG